MNLHKNKWNYEDTDCDCDFSVVTREINLDYKKLSKSRYKKMMHLLRSANRSCTFRYGASRDGYPYRCGCLHDCCGCISNSGYTIEYLKQPTRIKIYYREHYNY